MEAEMKRENLTNLAGRLNTIFNERRLNELGQRTGLCRRLRAVTPHRLGLLMVSLFLSRQVETIADIQRGFACYLGRESSTSRFTTNFASRALQNLCGSW